MRDEQKRAFKVDEKKSKCEYARGMAENARETGSVLQKSGTISASLWDLPERIARRL